MSSATPAAHSRARLRSTAWSASTRWERAFTTLQKTGRLSGPWLQFTGLSQSARPLCSADERSAMDAKPHVRRARLLFAAIAIGVVGLIAYRAWTAPASPAPILGVVHETEIRIAPETSGRLAAVKV